jgi:hypothetical protein
MNIKILTVIALMALLLAASATTETGTIINNFFNYSNQTNSFDTLSTNIITSNNTHAVITKTDNIGAIEIDRMYTTLDKNNGYTVSHWSNLLGTKDIFNVQRFLISSYSNLDMTGNNIINCGNCLSNSSVQINESQVNNLSSHLNSKANKTEIHLPSNFSSDASYFCLSNSTNINMQGFKYYYHTSNNSNGNISLSITFQLFFAGTVTNYNIKYGTGTAPNCNNNNVGSLVGNTYSLSLTGVYTDSLLISGLAPNTTYWIDIAQQTSIPTDITYYAYPQITVIEL